MGPRKAGSRSTVVAAAAPHVITRPPRCGDPSWHTLLSCFARRPAPMDLQLHRGSFQGARVPLNIVHGATRWAAPPPRKPVHLHPPAIFAACLEV